MSEDEAAGAPAPVAKSAEEVAAATTAKIMNIVRPLTTPPVYGTPHQWSPLPKYDTICARCAYPREHSIHHQEDVA